MKLVIDTTLDLLEEKLLLQSMLNSLDVEFFKQLHLSATTLAAKYGYEVGGILLSDHITYVRADYSLDENNFNQIFWKGVIFDTDVGKEIIVPFKTFEEEEICNV